MKTILPFLFLAVYFITDIAAQNFALNFDGDLDEVRIGNNSIFEIQDQFTIEAWINATEWRQESWQGSIVAKDGQGPDSGFAFRCGKGGTLSFVMSVNGAWQEVATAPSMDLQVWNHVAIVVDNGNMTLFINGDESATKSFSGSASGSAFVNLKIGASGDFDGRVFNGAIDEVRIWNIARSIEELVQFKNESLTGNENGLISYFDFNEGSGSTAGNKVNENLNGTLLNMTEDDWVGGASISSSDAGVTNITNPDMVSVFSRPVRIGAEVKNFGTDPISDIPINLMINGDLATTAIVPGPILADEKINYTFEEFVNLENLENIDIEVRVQLNDDGNELNDSKNISFQKQSDPNLINIFNRTQHNFGNDGQTQIKSLILPEDLQIFEQILLHIKVDCPGTGCDPWDQPANIFIEKDGQEFEIARYITPYRKGCGPWTVDITDFKSILGGATNFKSYIQVWGTSGWLLTLDMELIPSPSGLQYQKLDRLWNNQYLIYGDPAISYNLPVAQLAIDDITESSHLRMTLTGHGQGNTDNAAEFSVKTHEIVANNFTVATHQLWKSDCEFNTCADQFGTWEFDRAGWCPGEAVQPFIYNTTAHFNPGGPAFLDYKFEPYTNLLNTGYDGMGHTEPHYRMASYFIQSSSQRFEDYNNLNIKSIAVDIDSSGSTILYGPIKIDLLNEGNSEIVNPMVAYYVNGVKVLEETVSQIIAPGEMITYEFSSTQGIMESTDYLIVGEIVSVDENPNDNLIGTFLNGDLTSTSNYIDDSKIQIAPNPNNGTFEVKSTDVELLELSVFDLTGKLVVRQNVNENNFHLDIKKSGIYILLLTDIEQHIYRQKIVVTK